MKRLWLSLLWLPMLCCAAGTGTQVLNWTTPTVNTDGSTLTDLASYNVYSGTSPTTLTKLANVTAGTNTYTATGLTAGGTYFFAVSSVSTSEGEGAQSNQVTSVIPLPKPAAPTLTLGAVTAYNVTLGNDAITLVAVGTVPANTVCQSGDINGLHIVPLSAVKFTKGDRESKIVVARCSA